MPTKIKIFFAFLAVFAFFSVFSVFNHFRNLPKTSLSANTNALPPPELDTDHDGLPDSQEAIWGTDFQNPDTDGDGYLDGEEVASGHDPTVPGPNDNLKNKNVTKKLSNLVIAGLAEGSLIPGSKNYQQSLNDIANSAIDDSLADFNKPLDLSKLVIIGSSKENQQSYVAAVQNIFEDFFKTIGRQAKELDSIQPANVDNQAMKESFSAVHNKLQQIYTNALSLPIPENWKNNHIAFLKLLSRFSEINMTVSRSGDDPIKGAVAISIFFNTYQDIPVVLKLYADEFKSQNLSGNSMFKY